MTFRSFLTISLPVLTLAVLLASCGKKYAYESEKTIANGHWNYSDTLDFQIPVSDTAQLYDLYIHITYADTFPNQNVYMKIYTRFPDGKRVSRLKTFDLFDIQGKPLGERSGSGKRDARILLQNNLYFNQLGDHLITLEQYTRSNPLEGVLSVGLDLEATKKKR